LYPVGSANNELIFTVSSADEKSAVAMTTTEWSFVSIASAHRHWDAHSSGWLRDRSRPPSSSSNTKRETVRSLLFHWYVLWDVLKDAVWERERACINDYEQEGYEQSTKAQPKSDSSGARYGGWKSEHCLR
jgi:hypothetical protein